MTSTPDHYTCDDSGFDDSDGHGGDGGNSDSANDRASMKRAEEAGCQTDDSGVVVMPLHSEIPHRGRILFACGKPGTLWM